MWSMWLHYIWAYYGSYNIKFASNEVCTWSTLIVKLPNKLLPTRCHQDNTPRNIRNEHCQLPCIICRNYRPLRLLFFEETSHWRKYCTIPKIIRLKAKKYSTIWDLWNVRQQNYDGPLNTNERNPLAEVWRKVWRNSERLILDASWMLTATNCPLRRKCYHDSWKRGTIYNRGSNHF